MPKFKVSVTHSVERTVAIGKLKTFMESAKKDSPVELSDLQENWQANGDLEFAFSAMGFRVDGQMVTETQQVIVSGNLPFAALPFSSKLESQLASKIREAIEA